MDQLLGGLFGGQDDDDNRRQMRAQDFVTRYEQGAPWDNISDEEAIHNYQNVAQNLSPQQYQTAAADAFARLSPQQRQQFAQFLQQQSGQQFAGSTEDPNHLAQVMNQVRQGGTGGLGSLLGGGDGLEGLLGGGSDRALGGLLGGQGHASSGGGAGELLSSPIGKAVLGGVAAMAMKRMMDRR